MFSQDVILVTQWETSSDSFEMVSRWFGLLRQQLRVGSTQSAGLALSFVFGSWKFYCLRNKLLKSPSAVKCPTVAGSPSEKERAAGAAGSGNDLFSWETDVLQNSQASHFRHGQTHRGNRNMKYSHWILWWSFKPWKQLDFTSFLHRWWNNAPIYRNTVASSLRSVICICCMQIKKKRLRFTSVSG